MTVDPEAEITVTVRRHRSDGFGAARDRRSGRRSHRGSSRFNENYGPTRSCAARSRCMCRWRRPRSSISIGSRPRSRRGRARSSCAPRQPTGRVLSRRELEAIAELCRRHDAYAVTDEIYEHIYYEGEHIPIATLDGMAERPSRSVGRSKTFSVTGWRIGTTWCPARARPTRSVRCMTSDRGAPPRFRSRGGGTRDAGGGLLRAAGARLRARAGSAVPRLVDAGFVVRPPRAPTTCWATARACRSSRTTSSPSG